MLSIHLTGNSIDKMAWDHIRSLCKGLLTPFDTAEQSEEYLKDVEWALRLYFSDLYWRNIHEEDLENYFR